MTIRKKSIIYGVSFTGHILFMQGHIFGKPCQYPWMVYGISELIGRIHTILNLKYMKSRFYFFVLLLFLSNDLFAQQESAISLDGNWDIIFDDKNEGNASGWMRSDVFEAHDKRQEIHVPCAWETYKKDYEGVAFYRKVFDLPASWKGKVIRLQFGAVNYLAEVWLNDEVVGYHEGGFTPFEFRVDEIAY